MALYFPLNTLGFQIDQTEGKKFTRLENDTDIARYFPCADIARYLPFTDIARYFPAV